MFYRLKSPSACGGIFRQAQSGSHLRGFAKSCDFEREGCVFLREARAGLAALARLVQLTGLAALAGLLAGWLAGWLAGQLSQPSQLSQTSPWLLRKSAPLSCKIVTFCESAWEGSQIGLGQKFHRKPRVILDGKTCALVNMRQPKSLINQNQAHLNFRKNIGVAFCAIHSSFLGLFYGRKLGDHHSLPYKASFR